MKVNFNLIKIWLTIFVIFCSFLPSKSFAEEMFSNVRDIATANFEIGTMTELTNGQIMVGGSFTKINGVVRLGIARLNSDGTVDQTFEAEVPGPPIPGTLNLDTGELKFNKSPDATTIPNYFTRVWSIIEDGDGYLVIAENANYYGQYYGFLRLTKDGKFDSNYRSNYSGSLGFAPLRMLRLPSGKIAIAGISWVNNQSKIRVAILEQNGDFAKSFTPNPSDPRDAWGGFLGLAYLSDESILVAVGQPRVGKVDMPANPCTPIYKFNINGISDSSWESKVSSISIDRSQQSNGPLYLARVNSFAQFEDGRVLISAGLKNKPSKEESPEESCYGGFGAYVLINGDGSVNTNFVDREMAPQTTWSVLDNGQNNFLVQGLINFAATGTITSVNKDGSINKKSSVDGKLFFDEQFQQTTGVFSKVGRFALEAGVSRNSLNKNDKQNYIIRKILLPPTSPDIVNFECSRTKCELTIQEPLKFGPSFARQYEARFMIDGIEKFVSFQGNIVNLPSIKWGSKVIVSVRAIDNSGVSDYSKTIEYLVPIQVPLPPSIFQKIEQTSINVSMKVKDAGGNNPFLLTIARLDSSENIVKSIQLSNLESFKAPREMADYQLIAKVTNSVGDSEWSAPITINRLAQVNSVFTTSCVNGKIIKKISGKNAKCPPGFKKK